MQVFVHNQMKFKYLKNFFIIVAIKMQSRLNDFKILAIKEKFADCWVTDMIDYVRNWEKLDSV